MSLRTSDYDYTLPAELVADRPTPRRDGSRMLVVHRREARIEHRWFRELPAFLDQGSLAVLNNTRVVPARLFDPSRGIETLLLEQTSPLQWRAMVKPGRKMRPGQQAEFGGATATVMAVEEDGTRLLVFHSEPDLESHGVMPLPPYIARPADEEDRERYQTVYAEKPGAVAAPTAGLHFSREMLNAIPHAMVTLHVGAGTFKPVQAEHITNHRMHSERFSVEPEAARGINEARHVLAVGTTVVRVLESVADKNGAIPHGEGETSIFIHPPHHFRAVDSLLTNFHLPKSTLLMLVSAFAGRELVLDAYRQAVEKKYRFFSYGDCMLLL